MENHTSFAAPKFSSLLDAVKAMNLQKDLETGMKEGLEEEIQKLPWVVRIFAQKKMRRHYNKVIAEVKARFDEFEVELAGRLRNFLTEVELRQVLSTGDAKLGYTRNTAYTQIIAEATEGWVAPIFEKHAN